MITNSPNVFFRKFIEGISRFSPLFDTGDLVWQFYLPIKRRWHILTIKKYQDTFYVFGDAFQSFEITLANKPCLNIELDETTLQLFVEYLRLLRQIYSDVKKDPATYYRTLLRSLSPELRLGVIPHKFVNQLIPDYMRFDRELTASEVQRMIQLLKTHKESAIPSMTSGRFFEYCKIAYLANPKTFTRGFMKEYYDPTLSGKELYARFADGRDSGLKEIDADSETAFQQWYSRQGGHPWEIYRGGNSTHINMAVVRNEHATPSWKIVLDAFSSTRLAETCRIFLALDKAGFPFELRANESYLDRLLTQDWIGILPKSWSIAYGWHNFPKELKVYDCIHFEWFKGEDGKWPIPSRQIKQLVTWLPLDPLFVN